MGRIKTDMVKRTGKKLVQSHPKKFSASFDKNKKAVEDVAEFRSKKLRNVVVGHITRLVKSGGERRPRKPKAPAFDRPPRRFGSPPRR
jgi:small subunit ribosomal protein S17e